MKRLVTLSFVLVLGFFSICFATVDKPQQFQSAEVAVFNGSDSLYGTLLTPHKVENPAVVLIIAGSGATDGDGNQFGMTNNSLRFLAEELALQGIASVRYDKRCVGKSKCSQTESNLTFDDFIYDASVWLSELKQSEKFSKVYIAGHSEGSLIGMVAAQKTGVDGYISIAGSGKRIDKVILEQLSIYPEAMYNVSKAILDTLLQGNTVHNVPPLLYNLLRPSVQPYIINWLKYEPVEVLSTFEIPILIVQGTTDIQVSAENAELLSNANPRAKLVMIEGMNHVLKQVDMDRAKNMSTYSNPNLPVTTELVEAISDFILTH